MQKVACGLSDASEELLVEGRLLKTSRVEDDSGTAPSLQE